MPDTAQLYEIDRYVFDRRTGRYHGPLPSYGMVPNERIMSLIQERIEYHQAQMNTLTQALTDGRLILAQWERAFALQLKDLHLQEAALARGGWQNMTQADFGRVGRLLRDQYNFLHGFSTDIATGEYPSERILWRSSLYALSGRQSYWNAANATAGQAGMKYERRLAVGDRGTCSKCDGWAQMGWQPLGTLPAPGGSSCAGFSNCRCEKEYK